MDIRLALMAGTEIPIPECQLILHQPKIKEIAYIGEEDYFKGAQTLCVDKSLLSQDKTPLPNTSNFQILMMILNEKETKDKKEAVMQVLQVLFPSYKITQTPRALFFSSETGGTAVLDESNFEMFQSVLENVFCFNTGLGDQSAFRPGDNKQAQEIAKKLMRARQRVAAQRQDGGNSSTLGQYLSVLTVGLHSMSLEDCLNLTMYQMYDLIERYSLYINWDIDIRSRLAGAKGENQVENWMKGIH